MIKVLRPSKNELTGDYSSSHKGYDFSGRGDLNVYAPFFGKVTISKNSEERNWLANQSSDPYKNDPRRPNLITEDYGNYCKIKGEVDGDVVYCLVAHLEPGSAPARGTEVKRGQVIGKIGNTGNSTGRHLHAEFRDENEKNIKVEWATKEAEETDGEMISKEQIIIDAYKALTGEYPTDDEKKWRLEQNQNTVELIESLTGDGRFKEKYIDPHIPESRLELEKTLERYQDALDELKSMLGLRVGDNTEEVIGKVEGLLEELRKLREEKTPKTIYKVDGEDFEATKLFWNLYILVKKGGE